MGEWSTHPSAYERVTLERLEGVASAGAAVRIVRTALMLAGASAVPEEPVGFGLFVTGPLYDAVHAKLGADAAEALSGDLSSLFAVGTDEMGASGVRRREQGDRRSERVVLVASVDEQRIEAVRTELADGVEVRSAADVFSLLQLTEGLLDRSLVLLMDGTLPGLRGPMLMTLARVLPPTARLIFWGEPPAADAAVDAVTFETSTVPTEATASEVAALCAEG